MQTTTKKSNILAPVHKLKEYAGERPLQYSANVRVSKQERIDAEEVITSALDFTFGSGLLRDLRLKMGQGPASIPETIEAEYDGVKHSITPDQYQIMQYFINYPGPANDPRHKPMNEKSLNTIIASIKSKDDSSFKYVSKQKFPVKWRIHNGTDLVEIADTINPACLIVWDARKEKTSTGAHVTPYVFRSAPPDVDALRAVAATAALQLPSTKYDPRKDLKDFVFSCGMPNEFKDNFRAGPKSTCFAGMNDATVATFGRMMCSALSVWKKDTKNPWFNDKNEPDFQEIWAEVSDQVYKNPEQTPGTPYICLTMKAAYELMVKGGVEPEAARAMVFETSDETEIKEKENRPISKNRQIHPLLLGEAYYIADTIVHGGKLHDILNFGHVKPKEEMLTAMKDGKPRAGRMYYVYNKAISSVVTAFSKKSNELLGCVPGHFSAYGLNPTTVNDKTIGIDEYLRSLIPEKGRSKSGIFGDDAISKDDDGCSSTDISRNDYNISDIEVFIDAGFVAQTLRNDITDMGHAMGNLQIRFMLFYLSLCGFDTPMANATVFNAGMGSRYTLLFIYLGSNSGGPRTTPRNININYARRLYASILHNRYAWFAKATDDKGKVTYVISDATALRNFILECLIKGIPWTKKTDEYYHTRLGISFKDEYSGRRIKPGNLVTKTEDFEDHFFLGGRIKLVDGKYVSQIRPERLICGLVHHQKGGKMAVMACYARAFSAMILFGTDRAYFNVVEPYCRSCALALPKRTPENVNEFADLMEVYCPGTQQIRTLVEVDENARFEAPSYDFCFALRTGMAVVGTEQPEVNDRDWGSFGPLEDVAVVTPMKEHRMPEAAAGTGKVWSDFGDIDDVLEPLAERRVPAVNTAKTERLAENITASKEKKRLLREAEKEKKAKEEEDRLILLREQQEQDRIENERLAEKYAKKQERMNEKKIEEEQQKMEEPEVVEEAAPEVLVDEENLMPEEPVVKLPKEVRGAFKNVVNYLTWIKPIPQPSASTAQVLMKAHPQFNTLMKFARIFKEALKWQEFSGSQQAQFNEGLEDTLALIRAVALCNGTNKETGIAPPPHVTRQAAVIKHPNLDCFIDPKYPIPDTVKVKHIYVIDTIYSFMRSILKFSTLQQLIPQLKPFDIYANLEDSDEL